MSPAGERGPAESAAGDVRVLDDHSLSRQGDLLDQPRVLSQFEPGLHRSKADPAGNAPATLIGKQHDAGVGTSAFDCSLDDDVRRCRDPVQFTDPTDQRANEGKRRYWQRTRCLGRDGCSCLRLRAVLALDRLALERWRQSLPPLQREARRAGISLVDTCLSRLLSRRFRRTTRYSVTRSSREEAAPRTMAESAATSPLIVVFLKAVHSIAQGLRVDGRGKHRAARQAQQIGCIPSRRIIGHQDDGNS